MSALEFSATSILNYYQSLQSPQLWIAQTEYGALIANPVAWLTMQYLPLACLFMLNTDPPLYSQQKFLSQVTYFPVAATLSLADVALTFSITNA